MKTAWIALLGTLLGATVSYVSQRPNLSRSEVFARAEQLRTSQIDAYSAYAATPMNWRRSQLNRRITQLKSKFKSGEDYAKKVIETESITVMHAARMAEEAGRVYNAKIQSLIRPFLIRSPDGLVFKPGTLDKAHKAVFDQMFQNGKTETGELARDAYKKQWEEAKRLQAK